MFYLLSIIFLFWLFAFIDSVIGLRRINRVEDISSSPISDMVSVIVAAKDEEASIERTIQSLLAQTYPNMEIILVNDRSEDKTGDKMNNYEQLPFVRVLHISSLPKGWVGKNHALYYGYKAARGRYLLFTDADVWHNPRTIEVALSYLGQERADHLTLSPTLTASSYWLRSFIAYFLFGFGFFKRPWSANDDGSNKGGMGIGAFQLLTKDTYERIGTHQAFASRPDDDLYLGQLVKSFGFKQRLATAKSLLTVEWYPSLSEAIKGLEKNTFAGLSYSWMLGFIAIVGTLLSQVLPFVTVWSTSGRTQLISLGIIVLLYTMYVISTRKLTSFSLMVIPVFPLTALLFVYTITKALWKTYKHKGITWRGTFYSLEELRKHNKR
ncbi:glycosyltransferase [Pontibacillus salicampi]|uniref:4,4'-diaponeurosporenoate glycosyltransferase n=1 Tax=Pontibacillus salicampi TaxID=1449801 RepID=A0ABV6LKJ0_9BACI